MAGGAYTEFRIRTDLTPEEQTSLTEGLKETFEAEASVKSVSASFGRQIAEGAILAIIVSLLLVSLYIAFRFELKFAGPVMVSLLHDVLITVGIYALLGREVTTATVAAVLTVLGYSIYDTIIILDRVRENMPLMKRASFRTLANVSLWETIPRSLATTFITLLPISGPVLLRRRDAEGLRLRPARRHRGRRLLVHLHRRTARRRAQGTRAGVRAPPRRQLRSAMPARSAACCARPRSSRRLSRRPT